jgi:hypothetical protein
VAVPALVTAAEDDDSRTRAIAVAALRRIDPAAASRISCASPPG